MSMKKQLNTLKENWLILVLFLIVVVFVSGPVQQLSSSTLDRISGVAESDTAYRLGIPDYGGDDFAPDVEERVVIRDAYMSTEVRRGEFKQAEAEIKSVIENTGAIMLTENVNQYDEGWKAYYTGHYQIKVPTGEYESVLGQLKEIGEVKSFRENARDVTGTYTNLQAELDAEKERLQRYREMYEDADDVSDKLQLSDRIFNQERRIEYLEDAIENIDNRVDYSQISLTVNEKQSEYVNIAVIKLSQLVRSLVESFNGLLNLLFIALPWAAGYAVVRHLLKKK